MIAPDLRDELDKKLNQTRDLGTTTRGIASSGEFKRLEVVSSEPAKVHQPKSANETATRDSDPLARGWTAAELMRTEFPEARWAVRGFVPEGAMLLAGPSKIGKSWCFLALGIAVASGGRAFGQVPVEKGRVLYIAFEDHPARMKSRLIRLLDDHPAPEGLHIFHDWPKLGQAPKDALAWLNAWMTKYPDTRLILIDTFKLIRPDRKRHENVYNEDYEDSHALQRFALRHHVAVLAAHHTNQGKHDDPFHAISGSEGLNAGFDAIAVLQRTPTSSSGTLILRGRDLGEIKHTVAFDFQTFQWSLAGFKLSREREYVLEALREVSPADLGYVELGAKLGKTENAIKQLATTMFADGQIRKRSPGRYYLDIGNAGNEGNAPNESNKEYERDKESERALLPLSPLPPYRGSAS